MGLELLPPQPVLGWDALGTLVDAGWCVGSHTKRHPRLTRCSDAELEDELAGASATIAERLGAAPATLAYPYGDVDLRVQRAAATHYRVGCTTRHLPVTSAADPTLTGGDGLHLTDEGRVAISQQVALALGTTSGEGRCLTTSFEDDSSGGVDGTTTTTVKRTNGTPTTKASQPSSTKATQPPTTEAEEPPPTDPPPTT